MTSGKRPRVDLVEPVMATLPASDRRGASVAPPEGRGCTHGDVYIPAAGRACVTIGSPDCGSIHAIGPLMEVPKA